MTKSPLPGANVLLIGPSGTGKTYSIRTLVEAGITPFCIFTEPGFEVLGDIPADKLHWQYIKPADQDWAAMIDSATKINQLSYESLAGIKDMNKRQYDQFVTLLRALNNFKCDRDGREYGDVCSWGTNRALVLDGLSGASIMSLNLMVGSKPTKSQGEWGVSMDNLERLIQKLCIDTHCFFILIAHPEREVDEVSGSTRTMVSTLGKKLAPKLPRHFSDVIMTVRDGTKFSWSTAVNGADLKARNLPIADGLKPSFVQIVDFWKKQGGIIETDL